MHYLRSAELRFGKVRRESPVRADSEIGAPLTAILHGGPITPFGKVVLALGIFGFCD